MINTNNQHVRSKYNLYSISLSIILANADLANYGFYDQKSQSYIKCK